MSRRGRAHHPLVGTCLGPVATRWDWHAIARTDLAEPNTRETDLLREQVNGRLSDEVIEVAAAEIADLSIHGVLQIRGQGGIRRSSDLPIPQWVDEVLEYSDM